MLNSFNHYNSIDNYDNYDTIEKCQSFSNQIAITTPFKIQILLLSDEGPPGWLNELGSWDYLTTHTILSSIRRGFVPGFANYKKGALDSQPKVYQLLAHGWWFSPGTPASTTTNTGRHDIAEILLKVAFKSILSDVCKIIQGHHRNTRLQSDACYAIYIY